MHAPVLKVIQNHLQRPRTSPKQQSFFQDRTLLVQRVQDPARQGPHPHQVRWQGLQVLERQEPQGPSHEEEPQEGDLDRPLQEEAQEGHRGGGLQEEDQEDPEVPARRRRSHPPGHSGQA